MRAMLRKGDKAPFIVRTIIVMVTVYLSLMLAATWCVQAVFGAESDINPWLYAVSNLKTLYILSLLILIALTAILIAGHNSVIEDKFESERKRRLMMDSMAHDMKTPLSIIRSYGELLLEDGAPDKKEAYAQTIIDESKRMNEAVVSFLDLSKMEAGTYPMDLNDFRIRDVIEETVSRHQVLFSKKDIEAVIDASLDLRMFADRKLIARALSNFISNGIYNSPPGKELIISAKQLSEVVRIQVHNSGQRLDDDTMKHIWEPYYQRIPGLDDANPGTPGRAESSGSGLGLTIVQNICLLHGGSCGCENDTDGVTFWMQISSQENRIGKKDGRTGPVTSVIGSDDCGRRLFLENNRKPSVAKPWLKYYKQECIDKPLPKCSMYGQLKESSHNSPNQTALEYYGTKVTYTQMMDKIDQYAAAFVELGVKPGEYVSFFTVSLPEAIYSIYGLNKIGAVCNLIDVRTDEEHTKEFMAKAKSDKLIVIDIAFDKVKRSLDELGIRTVILQSAGDSLDSFKRWQLKRKTHVHVHADGKRIIRNEDFAKMGENKSVAEIPYEEDRPAIVTRTGGTTGVSKGVLLTNDSLNAVYANFRDVVGTGKGGSFLNFLPLAASYGIACGIHMGLCMNVIDILIPKFKPDDFADLIYKYKPNYIIGVPIFYETLLHSRKMKNFDLSFCIAMAAGGDSANIGFERRLREFTKARNAKYPLAQGYGMSEGSSAVAFGVFDIHKDGSAGIPCVHTTISIFKPGTTEELDIGESGEICITGPTLMKEYLDEPEETAHVMWKHPDGQVWIHSGDLGYIDEDGFLFLEGRMKRSVVRFDGHKSYPVQLEDVVSKHPDVKNCCVIAIQDMTHDQGELPLVIAEPVPEFMGDREDLRKEIMELCAKGIEERSQPADAVIVDVIPVTNNGKNDITVLGEKYGHYDYLNAGKA